MAKNGPKMTQNDVIVKKMTEIDLFHRFEAFLIAQGWLCHFPPVGGSERWQTTMAKIPMDTSRLGVMKSFMMT